MKKAFLFDNREHKHTHKRLSKGCELEGKNNVFWSHLGETNLSWDILRNIYNIKTASVSVSLEYGAGSFPEERLLIERIPFLKLCLLRPK